MTDVAHAVERRTLVATIAIAVLLALFAMNDMPVGLFQDDGHYLILSRALAHGDGYRYTNLPGAPGATHFPPGFPLLLAPIWWLAPSFPANVVFFKLVNVALLPLAALAVRSFARRVGGLTVVASSVLAVTSMATVPVLLFNGIMFSETVFVAALCATLILAERLVARPAPPAHPWTDAVLVGLALGALALLRTLGLAALPAVFALLVVRRRGRDAAWVLGSALLVLAPWLWWTALHGHDVPGSITGGYGSYAGWLVDAYRAGGAPFAASVLRENARGLLTPLTLFGVGDAPRWVRVAALLPLLAFLGTGLRVLWRRAPVTVLMLGPYLLALLVWPYPPDRFLWPLWPLLLVAGILGVQSLGWSAQVRRPAQLAARVVAYALVALFSVWHVRTWPGKSWELSGRGYARMGTAVTRLAEALPADGLVASDMDAMVSLYAERPAVPLLALTAVQHVRRRTADEVAEQLTGVIESYHPRWLLVAEPESLRAAQVLVRHGRLRLVGADPSGVLLYDVIR